MRVTWLVRPRSTSAAAAVHVRVRAMACRNWSDSGRLRPPRGELRRREAEMDLPGAAISHQRTARAERRKRRPLSREPRRGRLAGGSKGERSVPLARAQCADIG